jgi:hypothetical protein
MKKLLLAVGLAAMLAWTVEPARGVDKDDINRAIERGVEALRAMKQPDGRWPYNQIGATALAGLTLLECGVKEDDKDVRQAAAAVRRASIGLTHTYSVALSILFLDRLGDPDDVPLIESLMVRLMAGQDPTSGGWNYECPPLSPAESRRLQAKLDDRKELKGRRELVKPEAKRTVKDLSPEIREQLRALEQGGGQGMAPPGAQAGFAPQVGPWNGPAFIGFGDNSNTQFAALALWVGRRHGLPVERALTRLDRRFRRTQMEDGGWAYVLMPIGPSAVAVDMPVMGSNIGSTGSMTCAGILSLAITDGATLEYYRENKPKDKVPDISKDKNLAKALEALGGIIDNPRVLKSRNQNPQWGQREGVGGRTFYFLWSLERVAVALDLDTIGKKDWYGWGAEILLENQGPNGGWFGEYSASGADTCFALLFLKRANLARDLTAQIKGKIKDPGERVLQGGLALDRKRGKKTIKSGIENKESKPLQKPLPKGAETEGSRLAESLVKAPATRRGELLDTMESEKGVKYTEALAAAIPRLDGESHRRAREALANRLTRMKDETLADYLQDDDAEIRRAAALAVGQKESKTLLPSLIPLLCDAETSVVRAAHASLKALTGQDFGPAAKATREERDQAVRKWIEWWSKQRKKSKK